jgi:hypothetical protein
MPVSVLRSMTGRKRVVLKAHSPKQFRGTEDREFHSRSCPDRRWEYTKLSDGIDAVKHQSRGNLIVVNENFGVNTHHFLPYPKRHSYSPLLN